MNDIKITVETPDNIKTYSLITPENLRKLGKRLEDIQSVEYSNHYHGDPYTELDVALPTHPLIGSGAANITFNDGTKGEITDAYFQDDNIQQTHFNGKPHWNHETKYFMEGWKKPEFEKEPWDIHSLEKTDWIKITGKDDNKKSETKIFWK